MKYARFLILIAFSLALPVAQTEAAPRLDPELALQLPQVTQTTQFGVILTFHGSRVTDVEVNRVRALGVSLGVRMNNFPIMAVNATRAQIQQMMGWAELRSIYLNSRLRLNMHQSKPLIGISRLRSDAAITARNRGLPVSGRGVTIAINDTGIDGAHPDLKFNPLDPNAKTIQNVIVNPSGDDGLIVRTNALGNVIEGILPPTYVENAINSDTSVGHGTHCAGIAAGTGQSSGGLYQGVAPGAKLLGLGSGAVLFVLGQIAAFDYALTHQFEYNVRVISCSWGNSAVAIDPEHPVNVASRQLVEQGNIAVVFANGNDGPRPNSQNRWASVPWVITAGASTKDGRLASFSSRGIFGDEVIHPTVLTPGTGGPTDQGFTSAIIATRSSTNTASNGADADTEIPVAFLPFYTQISGTSMACPHLSGIIALMLEANPNLSVEEIKSILERTATPLGAYDLFEVGAGLANAHAAVDLALNPQKRYGVFEYSGKGLSLDGQDGGEFGGTVAARASSDHTFSVPPNTRFTFVQLDWDGAAGEDEVLIDNTNVVMNDLALTILNDGSQVARSDAINLAALFGAREAVKIEFPGAGSYTARVSSGLAGVGQPADQPYRLRVTHYTYSPDAISDLSGFDEAMRARALRLVYDRVIITTSDQFHPSDEINRYELAYALMAGARVMQYLPAQPSFDDIMPGHPFALVAESLKREGIIGQEGRTFGASNVVNRLELAVAMVRALRLDAQARAMAGRTVTAGGTPLVDNNQIPLNLRGYVQLAIDRGILQAFPAEIREIAPGQFQAVPGPRFEPIRPVTRADFINPMTKLINVLFGE